MLTARKERILRSIVSDFIESAVPVASQTVVRRHKVGASPATIRNDMAELEEEGYIYRPHISAGGVPLDKAYRYYMEFLAEEVSIAPEEERLVRHQFFQVQRELEEWSRLAAAVLARLVGNLALVTLPKASFCRLRHVELVSLRELMVLVIVLLHEAKLKQTIISLEEPYTQEELNTTAAELNYLFRDFSRLQIAAKLSSLPPQHQRWGKVIVDLMETEDVASYPEPCVEGYQEFVSQPEFSHRERVLRVISVLEARKLMSALLSYLSSGQGVRVIIGQENPEEALQECSVVVSEYGVPGEVSGIIGVVGPTRMAYERVIPRVRYLASLMSELFGGLYSVRQ